ncbi:unnamed protein product [Lymnaea stagnalis]|uniref:Uncharacterized protein n=1 Tax=Lymnaea stagnalis TaxID=6523 RepID=A0AAV2H3F9_LYMST
MFAATLEGLDVSSGLAVATIDFDVTSIDFNVTSSSGVSSTFKETVVLVFYLMIPVIIAVLLIYIFCFKRRRWHAKNNSGMYNDASVKLWMDQATPIPPEPQKITIKPIVRKPKKDLLKAKVARNFHNVANEEESEPYAKIIKTCKSNNKMEDTQDPIYNNEMENTSDVIYNNEMVSLETSSTESSPCTEQPTNEKAWDTAVEPDEESEGLVSRQSEIMGSDEEMCEESDQESPCQADGREEVRSTELRDPNTL